MENLDLKLRIFESIKNKAEKAKKEKLKEITSYVDYVYLGFMEELIFFCDFLEIDEVKYDPIQISINNYIDYTLKNQSESDSDKSESELIEMISDYVIDCGYDLELSENTLESLIFDFSQAIFFN